MKLNNSRLMIGAVISIAGAVLLLNALTIVDTSWIIKNWWPLLVIVSGVAMLISDSKNYLWALIVITIGAFLQLRALGYYGNIDFWQVLWPIVIIGIGVSIATGRSAVPRPKTVTGGDEVVAILGGSDQKNMSEDFTGGKVTAILGGAKIDLRKATVKKAATIEVFALMGGVEIVVPRGVIVENRTNAILGGIENKTDQDVTKTSPTLTVVGDVIMGGVEIKN